MTASGDGFLGRWSRRKREARADDDVADTDVAHVSTPDLATEPEPLGVTLTEDELASLPPIADLTEGSDIRMFLQAGVPRALRSAALRKVWMLTPAIRDYKNPAVDYAWDYNTPGGVPGDGLAPSPQRAAQMLRDLFAPHAPLPVAPTRDPSSLDDDAPEERPHVADAAPLAVESVRREAVAAPAPVVPEATAAVHPATAPETAPRKRHGGALPSWT
ncbi:Protein of unknown function [Loktanella fryxellensis]|uniref:DUF3306 domain-containing protein n=1 Tax=Loktanella fryxellensis TaxID=245187 RepID=A0A1H8B555_9RHOB|nr:DUF3306 domain-containing protein [Loktanella fryxellensis]SEM78051.1 Protein of unknown function [Loktanella fryxellensis]